MNILCSTDDTYVPFCGIMLTSLFENNKDSGISVYVLTEEISSSNEEKLCRLASKYGQRLIVTRVTRNKFDKCPIRPGDHISLATYFRLAVTDLLPKEVDKVIYLDCDIIVDGSLRELWDTDINEYPIGACVDAAYWDLELYQRLELSMDTPYFNAGVLLMNIACWREKKLTEKCFQFIANNRDKLLYHDQDTLNCLFHNNTLLLPWRYNLQTGFLYKSYMYGKYSEKIRNEVWQAISSASIIHFSGCAKPWHSRYSRHPYSLFFEKYKSSSLWKDVITHKNSWKFAYNRLYSHLLYGLGLVQQPETFIITHIPCE